VVQWKALPKPDGGSAAILLNDPHDNAVRDETLALLRRLATNPSNGINQVLSSSEIAANGGSPEAAFWVDMKSNFSVVSSQAPLVETTSPGGTHGYLPSHPDLQAAFIIAGPRVRRGLDVGIIDMRSIAPTLAECMGVKFTTSDLKALPVFLAGAARNQTSDIDH